MDAVDGEVQQGSRRPVLVWVISISYSVVPLIAAVGLVVMHAGLLPRGVVADPYFDSAGVTDLILGLSLIVTQVVGSILLWRLRRHALHLFVLASVLSILSFWWQLLIRDWVTAVRRIYPSMTTPSVVSLALGPFILLAVSFYIWRLTRTGVLK